MDNLGKIRNRSTVISEGKIFEQMDKRNSFSAIKAILSKTFAEHASNHNQITALKLVTKLVLKTVQENINHEGKNYFKNRNYYDAEYNKKCNTKNKKVLNDAEAKKLFDVLTNDENIKHLEIICAHRKFGWGERKFSFWGTNYTNTASALRNFIDTKTIDTKTIKKASNSVNMDDNISNNYYQTVQVSFDFKNKASIPTKLTNLDNIDKVIVGDIHGNFHKLIDHFIRAGIITISKEHYKNLLKNPSNSIDEYIENEYLKINHGPKLILLGDIFADRNPHDKAKLKLLNYLSNKGCNFTIIYSNHDESFARLIIGKEMLCRPSNETSLELDTPLMYTLLFGKHYKFCELDNEHLFTHAPINYNDFESLVKQLNINSELSLIEKINEINKALQNSFEIESENADKSDIEEGLDKFNQPVWKRLRDWEKTDKSIPEEFKLRKHISGHDMYKDTPFNTSLDNQCGKNDKDYNNNKENILIFPKEANVTIN